MQAFIELHSHRQTETVSATPSSSQAQSSVIISMEKLSLAVKKWLRLRE